MRWLCFVIVMILFQGCGGDASFDSPLPEDGAYSSFNGGNISPSANGGNIISPLNEEGIKKTTSAPKVRMTIDPNPWDG